ncbi:MAG: sugar transferase [Kiritimatiellae bacterium]|nr:sugar transferase [Kiritimatiellia bacterium]
MTDLNGADSIGIGVVLRRELTFLEAAYRAGDEAAIPSLRIPVLQRLAGCRPDSEGNFCFRGVVPSVQRVSWMERGIAILLLLLLSPLFLLLSFAVLCQDGFPVFFRQQRTGFNGKPFVLYKFRTMSPRAESQQVEYCAKARKDRTFKLSDDPRVTRLGRFLRGVFLDELPQLVNIVKGEMRFCGPRPLPFTDHAHYSHAGQPLRLLGVPGLTGLWQIGGRNDLSFDEMCLLDYFYLCNRTLRLDSWILWRTLCIILTAPQATRH